VQTVAMGLFCKPSILVCFCFERVVWQLYWIWAV